MADPRISRRAIVPGLAVGAAAALAPISAEAAKLRRVSSALGPCRVFRGHRLTFQFFLPAGPRVVTQPSSFQLSLQTLDGTTFVQHEFQLVPGRGTEVTLDVLQDGSALFNGVPVVGDFDGDGTGDAIIGILIGLLLPAVQAVRGTVTSFVPGGAGGRAELNYVLQDVLVSS